MTTTCKSCGIEVPSGQRFCSVCYGDPNYGRDGYFRRQMEEDALQQEQESESVKEEKHGE